LKVNLFLEFVHLLRYYLARHLLTCNTDWSKLLESKAHPYRSFRISRSYNNLYSLIKHDFRTNLLPNKHYKQLDSVRKFSFSVSLNNSHVDTGSSGKTSLATEYEKYSVPMDQYSRMSCMAPLFARPQSLTFLCVGILNVVKFGYSSLVSKR
jgi:hypothetical protein